MLIRSVPLWKQSPFVRILIPFVCGICLGKIVGSNTILLVTLTAVGWLTVLSSSCVSSYLLFRFRHLLGMVVHLLLFFTGLITVKVQNQTDVTNAFHLGSAKVHLATIDEPLMKKQASYTFSSNPGPRLL